ncbi:MAG: hypothetical protein WC825_00915 [Gallionellaceae bacterium]|jgi:hypothetical protein
MTDMTYPNGKWDTRVGIVIILILIIPPIRGMMESDMAFHMLLQFPLIFLAGWQLAKGLSEQARAQLQKWNHAGITGLLLSSMILMFWMIPKALDDVLISHAMELLKFLSLALAGAVLELSWQAAGMIMRGFFLGNVLPMMMVVGWLYIAAPVRLCNAYLTNDQLRTGSGLLALAICASLIWLFAFFMQNTQAESASEDREG